MIDVESQVATEFGTGQAPVLQGLQSRDPELAGKELRAHIEFFGSFLARRPDDHDRRPSNGG